MRPCLIPDFTLVQMLSEKIEANHVTGDQLTPFREAVKSVYEHYVRNGDFTWEEIEAARMAASIE